VSRLLGWVVPLAVLVLSWALPVRAQSSVPVRDMLVRWSAQRPVLSFSAHDFVTPRVAQKLDSGLPQRIVTRVYAYPDNGSEPIAVAALSCRVVYDLWEGVYRVEQQTAELDRSFTVGDRQAVIRACLDVTGLAIGTAHMFDRHRGRDVYFAGIVELNPLSPDTVQRIRRWLSKSGAGQLRGDAFFGSFVSIFVSRRMGEAEHSLDFRSNTFSVPP
jgi:hypothetical protein